MKTAIPIFIIFDRNPEHTSITSISTVSLRFHEELSTPQLDISATSTYNTYEVMDIISKFKLPIYHMLQQAPATHHLSLKFE